MIFYTQKQLVYLYAKYKNTAKLLQNNSMRTAYEFMAELILDLASKFKPKKKVKKEFEIQALKLGVKKWD